jgi:DNA polymerase I-like protein with 3'-5' exonuclease and polymerase domains
MSSKPNQILTIDIETTGLDPWRDEITMVGLYDGTTYHCCRTPEEYRRVRDGYKGWPVLGHNLSFDVRFLEVKGWDKFDDVVLHDTQILAHVIPQKVPKAFIKRYEEERKLRNKPLPKGFTHRPARPLSLKVLAPWFLKIPWFWEDPTNHDNEEYNRKDCVYTKQLFDHLWPHLERDGLDFYTRRMLPWARMCLNMSLRGISLNMSALAQAEVQYGEKTAELEKKLDELWSEAHQQYFEMQYGELNARYAEMAAKATAKTKDPLKTAARYQMLLINAAEKLPRKINYQSPDQMKWLLRDYLKLDITKVDEPDEDEDPESTGKAVLHRLASQGQDDIATFLEWRQSAKIKTAFLPTYRDLAVDGVLHPTFNITGTRTGRTSSSNPNCISLDTRILTSEGFLRYNQISLETKIAQYEPTTGEISFAQPIRIIHPHISSNVTSISNRHFNIVGTEDHRQLVVDRKTGKAQVVPLVEVPKDTKILHAGRASAADESNPLIMAIAIAIQADGHRKQHGWEIRLRRRDKQRRMEMLLRRANIEATIQTNARGDRSYFIKETQEIYQWIDKSKNKIFIRSRDRFSLRRAQQFCRELRHWDGLSTRYNSCYTTKEKKNADYVMSIYPLCNQRVKKSPYCLNGEVYWRLYETRQQNYSLTSNASRKSEPNQEVWCVQVPTSFIIIESGGCPVITGNCQQVPSKLYSLFKPREGMRFIIYDLSGIEAALIALYSNDKTLHGILSSGTSIHDFNAQLLFDLRTPLDQIKAKHPRERQTIKNVGFACFYGAGANRIKTVFQTAGFTITDQEAKDKLKTLKEAYSEVFKFHKDITATFEEGQTIENLLGRPIAIPDPADAYMRGFNTLIQSSASDLNLHACHRAEALWAKDGLQAHPLLVIHDCIVAEAKTDHAEMAANILVKCMTDYDLTCDHGKIKLAVEGGVSERWEK